MQLYKIFTTKIYIYINFTEKFKAMNCPFKFRNEEQQTDLRQNYILDACSNINESN